MSEVIGGKSTLICIKMYRKFEGKLTDEQSFSEVLYTVAITKLSSLLKDLQNKGLLCQIWDTRVNRFKVKKKNFLYRFIEFKMNTYSSPKRFLKSITVIILN